MNKDCGEPNTYAKCYNGNVIMVTETPACTNPGKPSAKCEWKSKTSPYQTCDEWEACFHGECVNETEITCKDACLDKGYGSWYCYQSSSCKGSDVWAALGDGRCMEDLGGPGHEDWYCCCEADSAVTTTTMLGVSTTTTTSPLSHKACVGTVCKKVSGPGINTCSTDLDCMAFEFHKECVGSMCESVFGKGLNECMTNAQCLALTETTLGHKVYHRECKGTSCMLVVGAGANECTSSIQCMSKFDITATTLHIGPDLGDLL